MKKTILSFQQQINAKQVIVPLQQQKLKGGGDFIIQDDIDGI